MFDLSFYSPIFNLESSPTMVFNTTIVARAAATRIQQWLVLNKDCGCRALRECVVNTAQNRGHGIETIVLIPEACSRPSDLFNACSQLVLTELALVWRHQYQTALPEFIQPFQEDRQQWVTDYVKRIVDSYLHDLDECLCACA